MQYFSTVKVTKYSQCFAEVKVVVRKCEELLSTLLLSCFTSGRRETSAPISITQTSFLITYSLIKGIIDNNKTRTTIHYIQPRS